MALAQRLVNEFKTLADNQKKEVIEFLKQKMIR